MYLRVRLLLGFFVITLPLLAILLKLDKTRFLRIHKIVLIAIFVFVIFT